MVCSLLLLWAISGSASVAPLRDQGQQDFPVVPGSVILEKQSMHIILLHINSQNLSLLKNIQNCKKKETKTNAKHEKQKLK